MINTFSNTIVADVPSGIRNTGQLPPIAIANNRVYAGDVADDRVYVTDISSYRQVASLPVTNPTAIAANADGSRVYVASSTGTITINDTSNNTVSRDITLPGGGVPAGAPVVSSDGTRLYVAANPGTLYVIDTSNGAIIASVGGFRDPGGVGLNRNESVAYVLANRFDVPSGTVVLFSLTQPDPLTAQ